MNEDHPKIQYGKTGVLLVNLGTPDSTSWWDIRKYLKEFLSDRRVIEVNNLHTNINETKTNKQLLKG